MEDSSLKILDVLGFIGVLVIKDRQIIFVNKEIENILGWKQEELISKKLFTIFPETAYDIFLETFFRTESGEVAKTQVDALCLRRNGENIYCLFSLAHLSDDQVVATVQDAANGGLTIDLLTGLYNRRAFFTLVNHETETAKRFKRDLFVVFVDVDGLKRVNDDLGHEAGDKLLQSVGDILRCTFRKSDIIARVGGDEFSVLALGDSSIIEILMTRLEDMTKIASRESIAKDGFPISLSAGAVIYDPQKLFHLALKEADEKMYLQKKKKKEKKA